MVSEINQMAADWSADRTALQERIAALEAVLRELVTDQLDEFGNCKYCHRYIELYEHEADCPIAKAKVLLGEPK